MNATQLTKDRWYQARLKKGTLIMNAWIQNKDGRLKPGVKVELLPSKEWWTVDTIYPGVSYTTEALNKTKKLNRASLPSVDPIK